MCCDELANLTRGLRAIEENGRACTRFQNVEWFLPFKDTYVIPKVSHHVCDSNTYFDEMVYENVLQG